MFKAEEQIYIDEGLEEYLGELNFEDNTPVIQLMEGVKKPNFFVGIYPLIDEASKTGQSDKRLWENIKKKCAKHKKFKMDKKSRIEFSVCHTAKEVIYNTTNFVEKNKDELSMFLT